MLLFQHDWCFWMSIRLRSMIYAESMNSSFYCSLLECFAPSENLASMLLLYNRKRRAWLWLFSVPLMSNSKNCTDFKHVASLQSLQSCANLTDRRATNRNIYSSVRVVTGRASKQTKERTNERTNKRTPLTCCVLPLMLELMYIHVLFYRTTEKRVQTSTACSRWKSYIEDGEKMQLST